MKLLAIWYIYLLLLLWLHTRHLRTIFTRTIVALFCKNEEERITIIVALTVRHGNWQLTRSPSSNKDYRWRIANRGVLRGHNYERQIVLRECMEALTHVLIHKMLIILRQRRSPTPDGNKERPIPDGLSTWLEIFLNYRIVPHKAQRFAGAISMQKNRKNWLFGDLFASLPCTHIDCWLINHKDYGDIPAKIEITDFRDLFTPSRCTSRWLLGIYIRTPNENTRHCFSENLLCCRLGPNKPA
jgi:hypothetical protein